MIRCYAGKNINEIYLPMIHSIIQTGKIDGKTKFVTPATFFLEKANEGIYTGQIHELDFMYLSSMVLSSLSNYNFRFLISKIGYSSYLIDLPSVNYSVRNIFRFYDKNDFIDNYITLDNNSYMYLLTENDTLSSKVMLPFFELNKSGLHKIACCSLLHSFISEFIGCKIGGMTVLTPIIKITNYEDVEKIKQDTYKNYVIPSMLSEFFEVDEEYFSNMEDRFVTYNDIIDCFLDELSSCEDVKQFSFHHINTETKIGRYLLGFENWIKGDLIQSLRAEKEEEKEEEGNWQG